MAVWLLEQLMCPEPPGGGRGGGVLIKLSAKKIIKSVVFPSFTDMGCLWTGVSLEIPNGLLVGRGILYIGVALTRGRGFIP